MPQAGFAKPDQAGPGGLVNQVNQIDLLLVKQHEVERQLVGLAFLHPRDTLEICAELRSDHLTESRVKDYWRGLLELRGEIARANETDQIEITQELARRCGLIPDIWGWMNKATEGIDETITYTESIRSVFEKIQNLKTTRNEVVDLQNELRDPVNFSTWADLDLLIDPIAWAWQDWLPNGMLTILAGESGAGKSALALRLAGCFLIGESWPDKSLYSGDPGSILWCEAEAAQAVNLERAKKWGYPLEKIYTPLDPLTDLKLDQESHLGALFEKAFFPDVRLIVVDSLRGANSRDENSSDTLGVVMKLAELARDTNKPIILTHHLRKRGIFDNDSIELERLRGSSAIVQAARLVWALDTPDPLEKKWKRLQVVKSNLSSFPQPVGMTIDDQGVKFGQSPEIPKVETIQEKASDLLLAILANEPMLSTDVQNEVEQAGISWVSAKRAKLKLGIVSIKRDDGHWYWSLPAKHNYEN